MKTNLWPKSDFHMKTTPSLRKIKSFAPEPILDLRKLATGSAFATARRVPNWCGQVLLWMSLACFSCGQRASVQAGTPTYQLLKSFGTIAAGAAPTFLIQGKDGLLYGTAQG